MRRVILSSEARAALFDPPDITMTRKSAIFLRRKIPPWRNSAGDLTTGSVSPFSWRLSVILVGLCGVARPCRTR